MELFHEVIEQDPRTSDDLRAEVSLLKTEQEDQLDETRRNEEHLSHVVHQQDPYNIQGPCPSKPFEGLEQWLPWHHRAWDILSRGLSCHRRRNVSSRMMMINLTRICGSQTYSMAHAYARHCVSHVSIENGTRCEMSTRHTDRGITRTWAQPRCSSGVPSTYLASRPLLGGVGQDSEGTSGHGQRSVRRMTRVEPISGRTSDHEDGRRLASGLSADLSRTYGADCHRAGSRQSKYGSMTFATKIPIVPRDDTQVKIILVLEDRQIQVIEEQATGEAQLWEANLLPH